ncbi:RtcB family protein, partial [Candidatus Micrarchaeota archaeon]|nr:RtcB family protein [Candidatus Micrarchaeota archaeon]MBU1930970.1 RtcB family protein [Candidatus Micrarchaeota archaeon]
MKPIEKSVWEIPVTGNMNVPVRVYANEKILPTIDSQTIQQAKNVASLPGIVGKMLLFSDAHVGYGMPIGGTAAFDAKEGIISPPAVGYDINCGMRMLTTNLTIGEVKPKIQELVEVLFKKVPVGTGRKGFVPLNQKNFEEVLEKGAKWCVQNGYGWKEDLDRIEEKGCLKEANPEKVSPKSISRGVSQLGTLGSGNHYLEVQVSHAQSVFDAKTARTFGIKTPEQIVVMIHCGSRGFGHQVCTDYSKKFIE